MTASIMTQTMTQQNSLSDSQTHQRLISTTAKSSQREPLVICGIGCRFPGSSNNPSQFWDNLLNSKDCVTDVSPSRWSADYYTNTDNTTPATIPTTRCGFIDNPENFDFESFNISKREAENMDIQQKILLEVTLSALEDSKMNYSGSRTGVYVGIGQTEQFHLSTADIHSINAYSVTGSTLSIASNRISYVFDLRGPSMSIDTACSSSISAFHLACEAINNGECDNAVVGGVNMLMNPSVMVQFAQLGVLSKDGRCKSFSDAADGYVRSEGCGIIVIRKLSDALKEKCHIYALIRGSACNQDGHLSPSLTMPSGDSQKAVFKAACERSGVNPKSVFYAEAHATGTKVGDPIEANAIGSVFGSGRKAAPLGVKSVTTSAIDTAPFSKLRIGSVKTNVGHLETASFMAGLIKSLLMLHNKTLVPNLYFDPSRPNKAIKFDEYNLQVQNSVESFESRGALITISSFGFGGSNGCALIEGFDTQRVPEYFAWAERVALEKKIDSLIIEDIDKENAPVMNGWANEPSISTRVRKSISETKPAARPIPQNQSIVALADKDPSPPYLFMVSAMSSAALDARLRTVQAKSMTNSKSLIDTYRSEGYSDFDISYTLNATKLHRHVAVGVGRSIDSAIFSAPRKLFEGSHPPPLIWVFAGQGAQHYEMGRKLFKQYPAFRQSIEECDEIYREVSGGISIIKNIGLFGDYVDGANPKAVYTLTYTLPCLVFLQVALCDLYFSFGIFPSAVIGHSFGEMAACYASGVCKKREIVTTAYHRARLLMQIDGAGIMMAVGGAPVEIIENWCKQEKDCWIAAYNGPNSCTVGGIKSSVEIIAKKCSEANYFNRVLKITNAYHTPLMNRVRDEALDVFAETLAATCSPRIPYMSTVKKDWKTDRFDGKYTWDGIEGAVHFSTGIQKCLERFGADALFMELAAHPVLSAYLTENGVKNSCYTLHREQNDNEVTLKAIATLRCHHYSIDLNTIYGQVKAGRIIPYFLPYPFDQTSSQCHREDPDHKMQRVVPHFLPLAGIPLPHPNPTYVSKIGSKIYPFTLDHCVQGPAVLPGAAYIEMAIEMFGITCLSHVTIGRALIIPSEPTQYRNVRSMIEEKKDEKSLSQSSWSEVTISSKANEWDQSPWVQHTTARKYIPSNLTPQQLKQSMIIPNSPQLPSWCVELPANCQSTPILAKSVYDRFKTVGLVYGPLFQGISELYTGDNCAWAVLDLTRINAHLASLRPARRYYIHPALLDSSFQVLLGTVRYFYLPYVPTFISKLQWFVGRENILPKKLLCYARSRVLDAVKGVIEGEIVIADESGRVYGTVEEMQCTALGKPDSNQLQPTFNCQWQSIDYPAVHSCLSVDSPIWNQAFKNTISQIHDNSKSLVDSLCQSITPLSIQQKSAAVESQMDKACIAYLSQFVEEYGPTIDVRSWPLHRQRFWKWTTDIVNSSKGQIDHSAVTAIDELRDGLGFEVDAIHRVGRNLNALLTDNFAVQKIFFGEDDFMARLYNDSLTFGPFLPIAAELISKCLEQNPNRVIHILEIGAGTGALTRAVLNKLPKDLVERRLKYTFSDVSNKFLKDARTQLADHTCIDYAIIDIENLEGCPVPLQSVDLLLGFDVMHVAADMSSALQNAQRLLVPNGLICLVELTRPHLWTQLFFGLFKQWWGMSDNRKIVTLTKNQWIEKLSEENYHSINVLNDGEPEFCHSIVTAHSAPLTANTITTLPSLSEKLTIYDATQPGSNINSLLEVAQNVLKKLDTSVVPKMSDRSKFILITTQSQTLPFCSTVEPLHADLIGFTRVLASEYAQHLDVIQIDVEATLNSTQRIRWIHRALELAVTSAEREFVVTKNSILVPRFVSYQTESITPAASLDPQNEIPPFRLEINTPGQLSTLRYHLTQQIDAPIQKLEKNQIRVSVRASALNFKDLMIALGMLNNPMGLSSEELLYDPTVQLGLEFSGCVLEIGSNVHHVKVGDEVFGLSKWCFANQVVTDCEFVALKPSHLSHVEAVSIPIVFATSYAGLIDKAKLKKGDIVLVHSAAGGIGQSAIQLCRHVGCKVIATVGSNEKRQFLKEKYGIEMFADSHNAAEWEKQVMEMTNGRGVNVVINSLKGDAITRGLRCLSTGGRFVEIGKIDILASHSLDMKLLLNDISFHSVQLDILMNTEKDRIHSYMSAVAELAQNKSISPMVDSVYACTQYEQAFRYLMSGNHKGKIILDFSTQSQQQLIRNNQIHSTNQTFNAHTVYMLSGGTGALALKLTEYLCKKGARYLLLFSRRGELSLRKSEIEHLKNIQKLSGAKILVQKCDVTDAESIQLNYQAAIQQYLFPQSRVAFLHLAMVLDDDSITKMTPDRMSRAMKCKIDGAKNFVNSFPPSKIEFCVFFSSAASTLGNPSQSNYSAANSFLDSYSCYLNFSKGIRSRVVNLGVIEDVGLLAEDFKLKQILIAKGFNGGLTSDSISLLLSEILTHGHTSQYVHGQFDWHQICISYPALNTRFTHLIDYKTLYSSAEGGDSGIALSANSLSTLIGNMLGVPSDSIDQSDSLTLQGLDSLIAVELSSVLKKKFNLNVSQMELLGGMSVNDLITKAQGE